MQFTYIYPACSWRWYTAGLWW